MMTVVEETVTGMTMMTAAEETVIGMTMTTAAEETVIGMTMTTAAEETVIGMTMTTAAEETVIGMTTDVPAVTNALTSEHREKRKSQSAYRWLAFKFDLIRIMTGRSGEGFQLFDSAAAIGRTVWSSRIVLTQSARASAITPSAVVSTGTAPSAFGCSASRCPSNRSRI
jgi:hypothetical protein